MASAPAPGRRGEPVRVGLPWPKGVLHDGHALVASGCGPPRGCQTRVLCRWSDGSIRWSSVDLTVDLPGAGEPYTLTVSAAHGEGPGSAKAAIAARDAGTVVVDTGRACFRLLPDCAWPLRAHDPAGAALLEPATSGLLVADDHGRERVLRFGAPELLENGPLRATVSSSGRDVTARRGDPLLIRLLFTFFADSPLCSIEIRLHNPGRARHPGGIWELGDAGSLLLSDVSLVLALPPSDQPARLMAAIGQQPLRTTDLPWSVTQHASGGRTWRSPVHLNRHGEVPLHRNGWSGRSGDAATEGERAAPRLVLGRAGRLIACAVPHFWQTFPKHLEARADRLRFGMLPREHGDLHELQGGERTSARCFLAFGEDQVSEDPLAWCHAPTCLRAEPGWYCATSAIPYLLPNDRLPADAEPNRSLRALARAAIDDQHGFAARRENIDEYGWRNFGDLHADHEAVFDRGGEPFVSHYNNQYDPVLAFGLHFLRSGDPRWFRLMDDLARHVRDIDLYHTTRDRPVYNGGLFWHTAHHVPAGLAGHRSYPRATGGGGPGVEHCYNRGLLLHSYLTGEDDSRAAALALAKWVAAADDGARGRFRLLDRGATGFASQTGNTPYHGPGRASGNALSALLAALEVGEDPELRALADALVRRCIHPRDDISRRGFANPEQRWSYTVFLYALAEYLDQLAERGDCGARYAYARASLLHYARWMADHEYVYLDRPELLEFPNETWTAQELRKADVLALAARHAPPTERARLLARADEFLRRAVDDLARSDRRPLTRPLVLTLRFGWVRGWIAATADGAAPPADAAFGADHDWGQPQPFVSQEDRLARRFKWLFELLWLIRRARRGG